MSLTTANRKIKNNLRRPFSRKPFSFKLLGYAINHVERAASEVQTIRQGREASSFDLQEIATNLHLALELLEIIRRRSEQ